ncbi:alpha/beta fold hydrolase [Thermomicrobium sp. CFH 73360]|uniref:alpha/beta fold hydrolase n=1 Tax=Thermomicrobium sp. CFH 73360 TaxID=2951987 RepID=UPI0020779877|nr:alpha/beta fold hydrolase [Thermomicrobium sp. CFH 73360]MCM8745944.1 alpha/beta fold hydrolase [Thermomicrobium sp. CFH 73360]
MATVLVIPKLGLTMTEGRVGRWLKQPGEPVQAGEPVLEVETEKLTVEVEAPASGILAHILAEEGVVLPVTTPVAVIAEPGEAVDLASLLPATSGAAVTPVMAAGSTMQKQARAQGPTPTGEIRATPAARKLARDHGIDLARVRGTGPGGRITAEDVEHYLASQSTAWPRGEPVHFWSDGLTLAGELFVPLGADAALPGVVLCTGIQGIKELGMPLLAQALADAGYAALIFDYRGFGASEGPRGRLLPQERIRDARAALTFLETHPIIDRTRLAILGLSLGGAHALSLAAIDDRVQACIAIAPVTNGWRWLRSLRAEWQWRVFLEELATDRRERVRSGTSRRVRLSIVMPPDPETDVTLRELGKRYPEFAIDPEITLESAEALLEYAPEREIAEIAPRPVLLIHGVQDVLVAPDESRAAYARAGDPKRLTLVEGMGHFNWLNPQHAVFCRVINEVTGWLRQWLLGDGSRVG